MKKELKKYLLVGIITLVILSASGCTTPTFQVGEVSNAYLPIAKGLYGQGGKLDWLVFPMAWLMNFIAKYLVNYNFALTILIATILVRSLAWPIYGKTNDMSLKMQLLGPELKKIEDKYAGKQDKESAQMKSMETMQLYKKYKVSFTGCLMPFLQMPIFLAFYETLRRIPFSTQNFLLQNGSKFVDKKGVEIVVGELIYDFGSLKTNLFGIDLMQTAGSVWNWQRWGVYIIAFLVGATQIGMQILSQRRTNKQKREMEGNVPEYRRKGSTDQQKQTEKMMKIMLYTMPIMMVVFVVGNPAALGWYWLVGNAYTALQTYLSSKSSAKKMIKLKEKYNSEKFNFVK